MKVNKNWLTFDDGKSFQPHVSKPSTLPRELLSAGTDRFGRLVVSPVKRKEEKLFNFTCGPTIELLDEVKKFWSSETMYNNMGLAYKRSILMYGPPGCGKSSAIGRLINEAIDKHDAIVFLQNNFGEFNGMMQQLREIEPDRKILVLIEDIDKKLMYDEEDVLELLDGNTSLTNILYVSTTNFIKRLPNRVVNRPGRVDKRIEFPYLSSEQMAEYMSFLNVEPKLAKSLSMKLKNVTIAQIKEAIILSTMHKLPVTEVAKIVRSRVDTNEEDEDE